MSSEEKDQVYDNLAAYIAKIKNKRARDMYMKRLIALIIEDRLNYQAPVPYLRSRKR